MLACDVGGTNTSIALLTGSDRDFAIRHRFRYESQALSSLEEAILTTLDRIRSESSVAPPTIVAVSGAGPIRDDVCYLSNVKWTIATKQIEAETGLRAILINDFSAVSYGIPLLDLNDGEQIAVLANELPPRPDGIRLVVGAGTGLGVGYLVEEERSLRVYPSEGGHSAFAPYDETSLDMQRMLADGLEEPPGSELFVSGRGIANALRFYRESKRVPSGTALDRIDNEQDPAAAVSQAAAALDPTAIEIMRLFVRNYARTASTAALHFLPSGGLFLAGGIAAKNERWFTEDDLFVNEFRRNYRDHIAALLTRVPIYIVRDYEISLYGAAYAAYLSLQQSVKR